jgi:hypothetical protein
VFSEVDAIAGIPEYKYAGANMFVKRGSKSWPWRKLEKACIRAKELNAFQTSRDPPLYGCT